MEKKLIAHRGLINGPDKSIENTPKAIEIARHQHFDVEIDLWIIDNDWFLGHDAPMYKISKDWITNILNKDHVWIHTKNIEALHTLIDTRWRGHFFWQQEDDFCVTSTGYIWTHFKCKELTPISIMLMPEWTNSLDNCLDNNCFGICSDYVQKLKDKY